MELQRLVPTGDRVPSGAQLRLSRWLAGFTTFRDSAPPHAPPSAGLLEVLLVAFYVWLLFAEMGGISDLALVPWSVLRTRLRKTRKRGSTRVGSSALLVLLLSVLYLFMQQTSLSLPIATLS